MSKFKIGDWVYTYDEQGLVYKHQVRDNAGFIYITGRPEPFDTKDIFKTKKECLKAMKDAGIQKASLHTATVIKLEKQIADLEAKLAEKLCCSKAYVSAIINGDKRFTKRIKEQFESQGIKVEGEKK